MTVLRSVSSIAPAAAGNQHRPRPRPRLQAHRVHVHVLTLGKTPSNRAINAAVAEMYRRAAEDGAPAGGAENPIPAMEDANGETRCL